MKFFSKGSLNMPRTSEEGDISYSNEKAKMSFKRLKDRRIITGRDTRGLAAAAIYIASILTDYKITQRDIASIAGVTEVTVRNRYKELVTKLNLSMAPSA